MYSFMYVSFAEKDLWTSVFFLPCGQQFISNWTEITSLGLMGYRLHNWRDNGWTVFSSYGGNLFETDGSLESFSSMFFWFSKGIRFSTWLTTAAVDHQFWPVILLKVTFICTTTFIFTDCVGFGCKVLVPGGHRGGFCEKLLEAALASDRANVSWLQDRPTAGQGQAQQWWW